MEVVGDVDERLGGHAADPSAGGPVGTVVDDDTSSVCLRTTPRAVRPAVPAPRMATFTCARRASLVPPVVLHTARGARTVSLARAAPATIDRAVTERQGGAGAVLAPALHGHRWRARLGAAADPVLVDPSWPGGRAARPGKPLLAGVRDVNSSPAPPIPGAGAASDRGGWWCRRHAGGRRVAEAALRGPCCAPWAPTGALGRRWSPGIRALRAGRYRGRTPSRLRHHPRLTWERRRDRAHRPFPGAAIPPTPTPSGAGAGAPRLRGAAATPAAPFLGWRPVFHRLAGGSRRAVAAGVRGRRTCGELWLPALLDGWRWRRVAPTVEGRVGRARTGAPRRRAGMFGAGARRPG